jgi:hypothetical protein
VKCGFNLGGILVIDLIIFRTFVLHFHASLGNCKLSVCLCIVAFKCSLSNWTRNWMGRYYHYIQETIIHVSFKNVFFNNYIALLLLIYVISYYVSCVFLCCLLNYFVFHLCLCTVSVIGIWLVYRAQ